MRSVAVTISSMLAALLLAASASATIELAPTSAIGFENDQGPCGANRQDVTPLVGVRDGAFAPQTDTCVGVDYFATGTSPGYLDAISLTFEVPQQIDLVSQAKLRVYLRKGSYHTASWHSLRIYPGQFTEQDEDCDNQCCCDNAFPGTPEWEGWVERELPISWIHEGEVHLTLRLWNAKVDAVVLSIATPEGVPAGCAYAVGFENDYSNCGLGPLRQDVTAEVCSRDEVFAPRSDACVFADYFATGASPGWIDALALSFDLGAVGNPSGIASAELRLYVKKGTYHDARWHAIRLHPGFMNPTEEDCDFYGCWTVEDQFPGSEGWEGWIVRTVPTAWITGNRLDLTLRIWNAKVDAVVLFVDAPTTMRRTTWAGVKANYRQR